jgi:opacity protein-like surface antigen
MKKLLLVAALSVATTTVFAQASKHEGFYLGADLSMKSTSGEATGLGVPGYDSVTLGGKNNIIPTVNAEYKFALSEKALLGIGLSYDLTKNKMGTSQFAGVDDGVAVLAGVKAKEKNRYSIFLKPGYLITNQTELYGILAYHKTKVSYDFDAVATDGDVVVTTDGSDSSKHTGMGYGAGVRTELTKNIFGYVEIQQVKYKEKDGFKPASTIGSVGVQYKF